MGHGCRMTGGGDGCRGAGYDGCCRWSFILFGFFVLGACMAYWFCRSTRPVDSPPAYAPINIYFPPLSKQPTHHHHHHRLPRQLPHPPSTGWAEEFAQQHPQQQQAQPPSWVDEFTQGEGEKWAGEFEAATDSAAAATEARAGDAADAMAATRRMVEVLSADTDPKMRNSQFLQFLSKMSRGELLLEEGGLKEVDPAAAAAARQWAEEFDETQRQQRAGAGATWADDFLHQQQQQHAAAGPAAQQRQGGDWVDEFARGVADLNLGGEATAEDLDAAWAAIGSGAVPLETAEDWVREFGSDVPAEWEALYADAVAGGVNAPVGAGFRGREYVFTEPNPFVGDPQALAKGKDL